MATIVGAGVIRVAPDLSGFHAKIKAETADIRDIKINVDVDTAGASAQIAAFEGLAGAADTARNATGLFSKGNITLAVGAGAAVEALIPLAGVIGGVAVALAAPLGAGAVGGGLFAFLAGRMIKDTAKVGKQIDDLRKKAESLNDPKLKAETLAQAEALEKSLSQSQRAFLAAKASFSSAFSSLTKGATGDAILRPLTAGLTILSNILPRTTPLITAVSTALGGLLTRLNGQVTNGNFDKFIANLASLAGPAITKAGDILASIGSAINTVLKSAQGTGVAALGGIANKLRDLSTYLKSPKGQQQLQSFFDWVRTNGPQIATDVGNIASAMARFARDVAPIGKVVLDAAGALSKLYTAVSKLGGIKSGILTALGPLGTVLRPFIQGSSDAEKAATRTKSAVDKLPKGTIKLSADASSLKKAATDAGALSKASAGLKSKTVKITTTNLAPAVKQTDSLGTSVTKLKGKTVQIQMNSLTGYTKQADALAAALGNIKSKTVTIKTNYTATGKAPKTAIGGIFNGAQTRIIGEAGPEAVVPLDRPLSAVDPSVRWLSAIAQGLKPAAHSGGPTGSHGSSAAPVTQNIYPQPGQSEEQIGRAAANAIMFRLAVAGR